MIQIASTDASDIDNVEQFKENKYWGMESLINVYGCDVKLMSDPAHIKQFLIDLCDLIKMERYGEPMIERFGSGNLYGYSAVQLIHTSCIVIHFAEDTGAFYLDLFSCKEFKAEQAANFARDYFNGKSVEFRTIFRD